jgi:hypothetical protein
MGQKEVKGYPPPPAVLLSPPSSLEIADSGSDTSLALLERERALLERSTSNVVGDKGGYKWRCS